MSLQQPTPRCHLVLIWLVLSGLCVPTLGADEPIRMRVETLTVPPATGPLAMVTVQNTGAQIWEGEIRLHAPESWQLTPDRRATTLAPGEIRRVAFNISQARNLESNRYPFEVTAAGPEGEIKHRQSTFVASAPYFRVDVDGQMDEWKDAIPVSYRTEGRATTISTYWSRRYFSLLVAVDEQQLVPRDPTGPSSFDAVQFAISPLPAEDEPADARLARRFEFLLAATRDGNATCFQLASYETSLDETAEPRPLDTLVCEEVDVAVWRHEETTYYECSVPFRLMGDRIQPSEGREFHFSVLVHDPDGTGLRDLGCEAGLWPTDTDRDDWSSWPGADWSAVLPRGNKIRWGLCTSKY